MQTRYFPRFPQTMRLASLCWLGASLASSQIAEPPPASSDPIPVKDIAVSGQLGEKKAQLTITANLPERREKKDRSLYTVRVQREIHVDDAMLRSRRQITFQRVQGELNTVALGWPGKTWPTRVAGTELKSWSIRSANHAEDSKRAQSKETQGDIKGESVEKRLGKEADNQQAKLLILQFETPENKKAEEGEAQSADSREVIIETEVEIGRLPFEFPLQGLGLEFPTLSSGEIRLEARSDLAVNVAEADGLIPVVQADPKPLQLSEQSAREFRFLGSGYWAKMGVRPRDPDALRVVLTQLNVEGRHDEHSLSFQVAATASTKNPRGARRLLLGGQTAITKLSLPDGCSARLESEGYVLRLERPGSYPIAFEFVAKIEESDGWQRAGFRLLAAALLPLHLSGFDEATEFRLSNGGSVEAAEAGFQTFLSADGRATLAWRFLQEEKSSKLFYNTESRAIVRIGTGVMRQNSSTMVTIMQGELSRLQFNVAGDGEITRVTAPDILSWEASPTDDPQIQVLTILFSRPQTESCEIRISTLSTLGTFPLETRPVRITPQGAVRHHGWIEVVNEGAVRLDIVNTLGLSRVSPENEAADSEGEGRQAYPSQRFAFRHSSTEYGLTAQVDDIQPEITASTLLSYHLGHEQTRIEADLDLEIREAPIRRYVVRVPADYAAVEVQSHGLSDFFIAATEDAEESEIRLEFGRPVFGRQQVRLRLEKNEALEGNQWSLGKVASQSTRQLRGHIGVSSVRGFRMAPDTFSGVSEIAAVYFPKQTEGLQAAFRITEADWSIRMNADPIPQAVQADCTHLYTIGNGLVYGSSLIQFAISGAPVDSFPFAVPEEYQNVEFTGEEVRNWIQTDAGYEVVLQAPRIGPYTLLVSYERPFQEESDTLNATGAFPSNAASERGTIILSSNRQIQLDAEEAPNQLIRLAPEELSPEHRLLLSQPVLAVFQYRQRPFDLNLGLSTLSEGSSVKQVVDRAEIQTRVSQDGQTVTSAKYYVKSTGSPHFQLTLPPDSRLWSARVDGQIVNPLATENASWIPLRPEADAGRLRLVEVRIASPSLAASPVQVAPPQLTVPTLYSKWRLESAPRQKLRYLEGSLLSEQFEGRSNGFRQLCQLFSGGGPWPPTALTQFAAAAALLALAILVFRLSRQDRIRNFPWRRLAARSISALALLVGVLVIAAVTLQTLRQLPPPPSDLEFDFSLILPGQTAYAVVENRPMDFLFRDAALYGWPLVLAALIFGYSKIKMPAPYRPYAELAVWLLIFFATFSWPKGGPVALLLIFAFLLRHFALPPLSTSRQAGKRPSPSPATATLTAFLLLGHSAVFGSESASADPLSSNRAIPDRVEQQIQIEGGFASGQVELRWNARAGETIPLLRTPGVLTRISLNSDGAKLSETASQAPEVILIALRDGPQTVQFDYQVPVKQSSNAPSQFELPTQHGLVNRIQIALDEPNAELIVPQAIAVAPAADASPYSRWTVIPQPVNGIQIQWQPRRRNRSEETPVYFAELITLLVPSSGLIEGFHDVAIRPAQGEVSQIHLLAPSKIAINDVWSPDLSQWRFEPENGLLKIDLGKPQSKPFLVRIRSQWIAAPLPYTAELSFPAVEGVSGQVGVVGVAAGNEVQIKEIIPDGLAPMDPQDFPSTLLELCRDQFPDAGIRRAFRYGRPSSAALTLSAESVEPHVAVTTNERLSIGEDRTLLATTIDAQISRAGVFHLRFALPAGMNVDSVSGNQLSHWTESSDNGAKTITLHLKQKQLGALRFDVTLSGPGISLSETWTAPKITLREADRQRGQLLIVPEQGVRLQPTTRDNVSPIDPRTRGLSANGAQAFDLLNRNWNLVFRIEQVAPWIEVSSLQDALFTEGKIDVAVFLDFRIKNTAVNSIRLALPSAANNVRFEGDHVADAISTPPQNTADRAEWTVRLQRRVIGNSRLVLTYQRSLPEDDDPFPLQGAIVQNANLQRSFLALRTQGRLQITLPSLPESLYRTDWHNVPRNLRRRLPDSLTPEHGFRAVSADFQLPLVVSRRQITPTLAAQVNRFHLATIVSQNGSILTQADIHLSPGSKRSLEITLPPDSQFWFARVNERTVSAFENGEQLLIPLGQNPLPTGQTRVQVCFQAAPAQSTSKKLDALLKSLNLDLPADSVTWTIYLDRQWKLADWDGDLQLIESQAVSPRHSSKLEDYLSQETARQRHRAQEAEAFLQQGNQLLQQGDEDQAQFAFQNAFYLTPHDAAFNEDARVQLKTLKTRQAMAGITVQQNKQSGALENRAITQSDRKLSAQEVLKQTNPADENTLLNLANRLVQQQDETAAAPQGFDLTLPKQGQKLQFLKSVQVESLDKISLRIQARSASRPNSIPFIAVITAAALAATYLASLRKRKKPSPSPQKENT